MAYTNNIPNGNDNISTSQAQIRGNFQFLADTTGNALNGFYRLPNGLVMQWGIVLNVPSGNSTVIFPIAYTTCFTVQLTAQNDSAANKFFSLNQNGGGPVGSPGFNGTRFFFRNSTTGQDLVWFAIGVQ